MQSSAPTVSKYLENLPADTRKVLVAVRSVIRKNLPKGYKEVMQYGMIGYVVPLSLYPKGYLGKKDVPLPYAGLAAQKNYCALYLMNIYGDAKTKNWFEKAYKASGKKLDMGKSCVRFKKLDNLPLDVVGKAIALTPVQDYIALHEKARRLRSS